LVALHGSGRYEVVPFPPERKAIDIGDYYSEFSKIGEILGWVPKISLDDGLARTLEYFVTHGDKYWAD
jgi:dTDP-glucose 4,6-dehydratase/UDP-glucose 4-epimerase